MGKIQCFKDKIVIRLSVDEVLTAKVATSKDVIFTLAEMISKFARMKAEDNKVDLPSYVVATSFDPAISEFVVTFSDDVENAI